MSFDASEYVKSEWLHGADLPQGKPVQATIKSAYEFTFENTGQTRPVIEFYELREKLTCNKTQVRELIALFGPQAGAWLGQCIEMLAVPSTFVGKPTIAIQRGTPAQPPTMHYQDAPEGQQATQPAAPQQVQPEVRFQ